ncbi:MAG: hypothetical protein IJT95_03970 [Abditibacteriota bacterium]|nr:hypothetical protein [Abditibacteriota bacterium]
MKAFFPLLAVVCVLCAGCSLNKAPAPPAATQEPKAPAPAAKAAETPAAVTEPQPAQASDIEAPKGYSFIKGIKGDFDCDGVLETAGLFLREKTSYSKEKPPFLLVVRTAGGETLMQTGDIITPDAAMYVKPVTRRGYCELLVTDHHGGAEDFYCVFVYGWKKYKGEPVFGTLFRITGATKAGDSVLLNGDNNLVKVFSAAADGDMLSGEATRFVARELYWKNGTLVYKREAITRKKYDGKGRNPNGFYRELGYDEPFLLTPKPFAEQETNANDNQTKDKKPFLEFLHIY